jgi:hypothetical protein
VYAVAEDHVDKNLLFAGTEFGLYFTKIGGEKWIKLNVGLPTIMVRDLAIQKQMDDLVIGTFGRGIYVLDDYSPLRNATNDMLTKESSLFPVKTALSYMPNSFFGAENNVGSAFWLGQNPPFGAAITYNLGTGYQTRRQQRQQRERAATMRGETPPYPTPEKLRAEATEEPPAIIVSMADASGKVIRRFDAPATRGLHRVNWDLRLQSNTLPPAPVVATGGGRGGFGGGGGRGGPGAGAGAGAGGGDEEEMQMMFGRGGAVGPLVAPGKYTVTLARRVDGVITPLPGSQTFEVQPEGPATLQDRTALSEFNEKLSRLQKALAATQEALTEARTRLSAIRRAIDATPSLPLKLREQAGAIEKTLEEIDTAVNGDRVMRSHQEGVPASIAEHANAAASPVRTTTGHPTRTAAEQYQIASDLLAAEIPKLRKLLETDVKAVEKQLDAAGAPATPGRLPEWKGGR